MTARAILLGILLGLAISAFNYFNDHVIRQTFLIGNHLPAGVFGTGLLLLLVVNPVLRAAGNLVQWLTGAETGAAATPAFGATDEPAPPAMSRGDRWILKPSEVAIILALGLAACAWPGSNLLRYFSQMVALPVQRLPTQPLWLSTGVMSYVPGQSPLLAEGYVADWDALLTALREASSAQAASPAHRIWSRLDAAAQRTVREARLPVAAGDRSVILGGLNRAIRDLTLIPPEQLADAPATGDAAEAPAPAASPLPAHEVRWLNRAYVEAHLSGLRSPPSGSGVLLQAPGRQAEVIDALVTGTAGRPPALHELPWDAWWPTLRLWGGALLFAALATLCLMAIVHPQWAHRELLRYPTVEFVHEMTRWRPGRSLPDIASSRMFWLGVVPVALLHLVNGLHGYFDNLPEIVRELAFDPLRELFPNAARVPGQERLFHPVIFPSVIGFGYFVTTRVSLSIGLSLVFWVMLGSWLLATGTSLDSNKLSIGANGTALRFGAYIAMTGMLIYFGRRYYWNVAQATVGLPRAAGTPGYAVWAARGLALFSAVSVWFLTAYANLSPLLAVLFLALFLMMLLVLARINAETGLFYAQPDWIPGTVLAGIFGLSGLGAEGLVVILIASWIFAADPREGLSPYLANALRLGDRIDRVTPRGLAPWLGGMILAGFVVALCATLWLQYSRGWNPHDGFANTTPIQTIDRAAASLNELDARGELGRVAQITGLEHFEHANPDTRTLTWAAVGFALLLGCAIARIRIPWWPLHPVLFLVWGTYPANYFAVSFLLAATVKATVTRIGGAKAYDDAKPMMVGFIAGDVLMIIVWSIVGTAYYFSTSLPPPVYRILPT